MLYTICEGCETAEHDRCTPIIQEPHGAMLGGVGCRCQGECVDGRYIERIVLPEHIQDLIEEANAFPPESLREWYARTPMVEIRASVDVG